MVYLKVAEAVLFAQLFVAVVSCPDCANRQTGDETIVAALRARYEFKACHQYTVRADHAHSTEIVPRR